MRKHHHNSGVFKPTACKHSFGLNDCVVDDPAAVSTIVSIRGPPHPPPSLELVVFTVRLYDCVEPVLLHKMQVGAGLCTDVDAKNKSRNAFLTPGQGCCAQLTGPGDPDDGYVPSRRQPCNIILLFDRGSSTCCVHHPDATHPAHCAPDRQSLVLAYCIIDAALLDQMDLNLNLILSLLFLDLLLFPLFICDPVVTFQFAFPSATCVAGFLSTVHSRRWFRLRRRRDDAQHCVMGKSGGEALILGGIVFLRNSLPQAAHVLFCQVELSLIGCPTLTCSVRGQREQSHSISSGAVLESSNAL
ncbi:hypothetical protein T4D_7049 [Trichinella pseudospiralis]|uniref:Uncharacterized protein n=1 Tax=Trichinella pseudospiralis TaxID=6337 RepID=A0A0V1FBJ6_TRIPS|nr:hypothetical protein T4D_7049 [Trichinella pseudospiralis]